MVGFFHRNTGPQINVHNVQLLQMAIMTIFHMVYPSHGVDKDKKSAKFVVILWKTWECNTFFLMPVQVPGAKLLI